MISRFPFSFASTAKLRLYVQVAAALLLMLMLGIYLKGLTGALFRPPYDTISLAVLIFLWALGLYALAILGKLPWDVLRGRISHARTPLYAKATLVQRAFLGTLAVAGLALWFSVMIRVLFEDYELTSNELIFATLTQVGCLCFGWIALRGPLPAWFERGNANPAPPTP